MNGRPLRVLAICGEDPEWILGGMGRHVRELYRAMARRPDVEIDLLTHGPGETFQYYLGFRKHVEDRLICYKPKLPGLATLYAGDIQLAKTFARLLAVGQRWDLVHVHEWNAVQLAQMARDALDVPLVGTMHLCITHLTQVDSGPTHQHPPGQSYTEDSIYTFQQEGHLVWNPEEFIACSFAYRDLIRRVFLTDRPINVIYNGIRAEEWAKDVAAGEAAYQKFEINTRRHIALYVGRIADQKGIRPLLDALEAVDPGYLVLLAGEVNANTPEQREAWDVTQRLRALQEEFPERVRWLGFVGDEDLKGLLSIADVGLMPSLHEPFGIAALEFMAAGVPLISTEVDGLGEVVANGAGEEYALIIEPNQPGQILAALEMLQDPFKRAELRRLGWKRVKDFDWDQIAGQTVAVYHKALERKKAYDSYFANKSPELPQS